MSTNSGQVSDPGLREEGCDVWECTAAVGGDHVRTCRTSDGLPRVGRPTRPVPRGAERLVGVDANAYAIMNEAAIALRKAGASDEFIRAYRDEAVASDYLNVIATSIRYLDAEYGDEMTESEQRLMDGNR